MSRSDHRFSQLLVFTLIITSGWTSCAQQGSEVSLDAAARSIMTEVRYAGLTTIDSLGYPNTRTMDALPPIDEFTVWLATNPVSRKVTQILANPSVSLYYAQSDKGNYVTLIGNATIVNDPVSKKEQWREEWTEFYPTKNDMVLIKIEPIRLEVVSYEFGIISQTKDWKAPEINLQKN